MGMPKEGGNKPSDLGLSDFKVLSEHKGVGPRVQKTQEPKPQPPDPGLAAYSRLFKAPRGSAIFENPIQVPRPLPQNSGEQRGEAEPSPPSHAEQQDRERLGKPLPDEGEQEINSMLPSYIRRMDRFDRELISYKLVPDREFLEEMGWDNFAELSLDLSSSLPKPEDPTPKLDYRSRRESQRLSEHLTANEWEKTIVDSLEAQGSHHLIPQFTQDMQEYREAVKDIVEMWRQRGLL
jgi:hypothetical protein